MSSLVTYGRYIDECASIFTWRLDEMPKAGIACDMGHWFQCYAFNVVGEIAFEWRFGFFDAGIDVGGVMSALHGNIMCSTLIEMYSSPNMYLFPVMSKLRLGDAAGKAYMSALLIKRSRNEKRNWPPPQRSKEPS